MINQFLNWDRESISIFNLSNVLLILFFLFFGFWLSLIFSSSVHLFTFNYIFFFWIKYDFLGNNMVEWCLSVVPLRLVGWGLLVIIDILRSYWSGWIVSYEFVFWTHCEWGCWGATGCLVLPLNPFNLLLLLIHIHSRAYLVHHVVVQRVQVPKLLGFSI